MIKPPTQPYYSSLRPFADLFQTGRPILTYHKLGPRPSQARLKGLYMSQGLFARQLAELRAAGFNTPPMRAAMTPVPDNARKQILLTFDDGFRNVLEHGLAPLARNDFRAVQFIVVRLIGKTNEWDRAAGEVPEPLMDDSQIRDWIAAGHEIGSHSLTHPYLTCISPREAREEICSSRERLQDKFGVPVEHFCYPYGNWNAATRDLVQEAGYRTAVTTEYGVNGPEANPLSLRRITARYPSRSWKTVRAWFAGLRP